MNIEINRLIAQHHIILKAGFAWAAMLKDAPNATAVMRHKVKQAFADYWRPARRLTVEYNRVCDAAGLTNATQDAEALAIELLQELFQSPDPVRMVAVAKAFNQGGVEVKEECFPHE